LVEEHNRMYQFKADTLYTLINERERKLSRVKEELKRTKEELKRTKEELKQTKKEKGIYAD